MFIFLYGPDIYRSRQKLKEIIKYYKESCKNGFNLKYFDLSSQISLKDEIQQTSIFDEKKLLVLEGAIYNKNFNENFLKEAKNFIKLDDIILFYEEKEVPQKDPLFIFLKKYGKCQEFKLLNNQKLENWIKKEFSTYEVEIGQGVVRALIDFVGNDLWRLSNEIKKLASYKKGEKVEVGEEGKSSSSPPHFVRVGDVELLVKPKIETDIFKTIGAIAVKDKKQALDLLHKHLERGDNPLYLLSMINFQFRNLLIIKDLIERGCSFYAVAKETRLHPYVIKKTYFQAQKFTLQELKKIYQKIFQIDLKIKTGQINSRLALDLFIAESC